MVRKLLALGLVALAALISSCENKELKQQEELEARAGALLRDCAAASQEELRTLELDIELHLTRYSESGARARLNKHLARIQECFTEKLIAEYRERYRRYMATTFDDAGVALRTTEALYEALVNEQGQRVARIYPESSGWADEVQKARHEFARMKEVLDYHEHSQGLEEMAEGLGHVHREFAAARHEVVSRSWIASARAALSHRADEELKLHSHNMEQRLLEEVKARAGSLFSGFVINGSQPITRVYFSGAHPSANGEECVGEGIYTIYYIGAYWGIDRGVAKVRIRGKYAIRHNRERMPVRIAYETTDFSVVEKEGDI